MEQIINELNQLNKKDLLDIISIMAPIILSIIVAFQNNKFNKTNENLQKQIHNNEQNMQYHNDILTIYNTYNEFCNVIINFGFYEAVKTGNVNYAYNSVVNLNNLKNNIVSRKNISKLLFQHSDNDLYKVIEDRFDLAISIIDKLLEYMNSGKMYNISEQAWDTIISAGQINPMMKYDYSQLKNTESWDRFKKLCNDDDVQDIDKDIDKYKTMHKYDMYDKYFEKYIGLKTL